MLWKAYMGKIVSPSWKLALLGTGGALEFVFPSTYLQGASGAVLFLFLADWIMGVCVAFSEGVVTSAGFRRAFVKLIGYVCYIGAARALDFLIPEQMLEAGSSWRMVPMGAVLTGLAFNDLVSIVEKLKKLGIGVDQRLVKLLMDRVGPQNGDGDK